MENIRICTAICRKGSCDVAERFVPYDANLLESSNFPSFGHTMHENIYWIGKDLRFVKREVRVRKFMPWLDKHIQAFSRTTAWKYMDFARRCDSEGQLVPYDPNRKCSQYEHLESPPLPEGQYRTISPLYAALKLSNLRNLPSPNLVKAFS